MINAGVDQIVLGCTHYPFFTPLINTLVPQTIQIVNPAPAIAKRTKMILEEEVLISGTKENSYIFYSSGDKTVLKLLLKNFTTTEYSIQ